MGVCVEWMKMFDYVCTLEIDQFQTWERCILAVWSSNDILTHASHPTSIAAKLSNSIASYAAPAAIHEGALNVLQE